MSALLAAAVLQTVFRSNGNAVHTITDQDGTARSEHWKRQRRVGRGAFGDVWLEQCVEGHPEVELRAVKEIHKSLRSSKTTDYHRELEAILRFSQRKYKRRFVESYGWYENEDSIFIAMEYFLHGDLQQHLDTSLPELDVRKISLQVLDGLYFMHQNAYSHRDLKPKNILVKSMPPNPWWVKLSDFGISKRSEDNATNTSWTRAGTDGYMAPELLDYLPSSERVDPQAADIWALGVVAHQMLTTQLCFPSPGLLVRYVNSPGNFPLDLLLVHKVSNEGVQFLLNVMTPDPTDRFTAAQAREHTWVDQSSIDADENRLLASANAALETEEESLFIPSGRWDTVTNPGATSSSSGVTMVAERDIMGNTTGRPLPNGNPSDSTRGTSIDLQTRRQPSYYILKSDNETDIETSIAHNIWCCGMNTNKKLSKKYNNAQGPLFLIFSVNKSRQFCGVARMRSPWVPEVTSAHWVSDEYEGGFHVEWLSLESISFDDVSTLTYRADGEGITINHGQQLLLPMCQSTGREMMRRFGVTHLVS